jgi:hypothetical protein
VQLQGGNGIDTAIVYQYVVNAADVPFFAVTQEGLGETEFFTSLQLYP